jgi:predicted metal-dependent phosphoesterase TrpH
MTPRPADLHVHTTHSDGLCSPGDVVRAAAAVGLSALAITDHDTLSAIPVARPEADRLGIELIPGVEITSERDGRELHILGHFVEDSDVPLRAALDRLRQSRLDRLVALADRLATDGYRVDLDAIRSHWPHATLGRRHLAEWLARTRQLETTRVAFLGPLADHRTADLPKPRLPWRQAVALIQAAGGSAALAHPPRGLGLAALADMRDAGLVAMEVDGPRVPNNRARSLRDLATRLDLVPIAGSDFHAPDRPGAHVGSVTTPAETLARLKSRAGRMASSFTSN